MTTLRTLTTAVSFLMMTGLTGLSGAAAAAPADAPADEATVERLRAEAERARAEAERARAEAERARAETERLRAEASAASVGVAETVEVDPGAWRRDGFFLRMAVGAGYAGYRSSGELRGTFGARDLEQDSPAGSGALSLGGVIAEDLALHADLWGFAGPYNGHEGAQIDVGNGNIGLGLTHYWMPWNVYVSGAVGLSVTTWHLHGGLWDDDDERTQAAPGVGTYLMVGKEWWVSENWSLGVGLRGEYAWTTDEDVTFHHYGAQALFTATFN